MLDDGESVRSILLDTRDELDEFTEEVRASRAELRDSFTRLKQATEDATRESEEPLPTDD